MEKNSIATSFEQSKRLLELGIDPATATMLQGDEETPAWTLGDLISILPKMIPVDGVMYLLEMTKREIRYVRRIGGITGYRRCAIIGDDSNSTLIDIAVEAIVTLKKEGII